MAVLAGVILMLSPWASPISIGVKFLIALVGAILCWLGVARG